jgi:predicted SnoaL-like aldol condensation-catalyzing enzyme
MENESIEERNKTVIRRWVDEMYAEARWELVKELAGPLYIRHEPSGTFTVTVEEQMALLKERYSGRKEAQNREVSYKLFGEGDKVCMIGTFRGYRKGGGADDSYNYVQVFRLENGKIVETWFPGLVKNVEW